MHLSISPLTILTVAALLTSSVAVDIEARQSPALPATQTPVPTSTTNTSLDPSQSASQSLAVQSALVSYASSLSAAGYTLAGPGASAAAKAATHTSDSESSIHIIRERTLASETITKQGLKEREVLFDWILAWGYMTIWEIEGRTFDQDIDTYA
ncbi:hypothetical protein SBOR_5303 [Sclerotinia borealis F-4128]|uniref:Uncharacterized protein n=1 Tax=Sclerotinia borealis (strain F-4128) TaxID=1432307 RepID=W9CC45_SCLBF|nr:hypothetical protein SBOR_5303 [Sclerotinia borealis F-4128]